MGFKILKKCLINVLSIRNQLMLFAKLVRSLFVCNVAYFQDIKIIKCFKKVSL